MSSLWNLLLLHRGLFYEIPIKSSPQNNNIQPHNQSTVQPVTAIYYDKRGIEKFHEVSGDITKITQACTAAQENAGKLIGNTISQALTKPQDTIPPNP